MPFRINQKTQLQYKNSLSFTNDFSVAEDGGEPVEPSEEFRYREIIETVVYLSPDELLLAFDLQDYPKPFLSYSAELPVKLLEAVIEQNIFSVEFDESELYQVYPDKSLQELIDDGDVSVKWFKDGNEIIGETDATLPLDSNNGDQGKTVYSEVTNNIDASVVTSNTITVEETSNSIIFIHRFSDLQDYDNDLISFLNNNYIVDTVFENDLNTIDYSNYDIVIIGAPDTSYTQISNSSTIESLGNNIISLCRYTSRIQLNMSSSSGSTSVSEFNSENNSHPIVTENGENVILSSSTYTSHRISSLSSSTELIYNNGSSGNAGLAIRENPNNTDNSYIHFGFHRFDQITNEGKELFINIINYIL